MVGEYIKINNVTITAKETDSDEDRNTETSQETTIRQFSILVHVEGLDEQFADKFSYTEIIPVSIHSSNQVMDIDTLFNELKMGGYLADEEGTITYYNEDEQNEITQQIMKKITSDGNLINTLKIMEQLKKLAEDCTNTVIPKLYEAF